MEDFRKELKQIKVLLKDDILRLRQYINTKFPHYNNEKRAEIFINTLRSILDKHLVGIPSHQQSTIREKLLKEVLISKPQGLFLDDIFEATLSLEGEAPSFSQELCQWVNMHISSPINSSSINSIPINSSLFTEASNISENNLHLNPQGHINTLNLHNYIEKNKIKILLLITLSISSTFILIGPIAKQIQASEAVLEEPVVYTHPHLPTHFHYKDIDTDKLKAYLNTKNSLLAQEPYFTAIIETSKEFDLNPLILFAIAGHEQAFVPTTHPSAEEIANNPYNVFVSWQSYNTDIIDSSKIVSRTIINLSKDMPTDLNPFQWINRKYAEDESWWKGVDTIYNRLEKEVL